MCAKEVRVWDETCRWQTCPNVLNPLPISLCSEPPGQGGKSYKARTNLSLCHLIKELKGIFWLPGSSAGVNHCTIALHAGLQSILKKPGQPALGASYITRSPTCMNDS